MTDNNPLYIIKKYEDGSESQILNPDYKPPKFISKLSKVRGLHHKNDYLFQVENTKFRFIKVDKHMKKNWLVTTYVDFDNPDFQFVGRAGNLKQCKNIAIQAAQ